LTTPEIARIAELSGGAQALIREDLSPSQYLDLLEDREMFEDAIKFHAHSLPPEGSIRWAQSCLKELGDPETAGQRAETMGSVDKWLQTRDDASRRAAGDTAQKAGMAGAAEIIAMGVFLSGGSITPPGAPETPPPPNTGQKLAAAGVTLVVVSHAPERATERYHRVLALARKSA
jgi:hypothetical protein